jgi:hypothetical protein
MAVKRLCIFSYTGSSSSIVLKKFINNSNNEHIESYKTHYLKLQLPKPILYTSLPPSTIALISPFSAWCSYVTIVHTSSTETTSSEQKMILLRFTLAFALCVLVLLALALSWRATCTCARSERATKFCNKW